MLDARKNKPDQIVQPTKWGVSFLREIDYEKMISI